MKYYHVRHAQVDRIEYQKMLCPELQSEIQSAAGRGIHASLHELQNPVSHCPDGVRFFEI